MCTDDEFRALIEASSLGTPVAKALRERGRLLLYGPNEPDRTRLYEIGEALTAGRITADDAYKQFIDAGCLPLGARLHVRLRA